MNKIINFFKSKRVQIAIIFLLIILIILLMNENFKDTFSVPPHIEQLEHKQLIPQEPPASSQSPTNINENGIEINPPNFKREEQINNKQNTNMIPGNIYRRGTGRDAYQEEQFVSIYDSNFGGMLGTNMGLN